MQAFRKTPSLVFLLLAILIGGYIRLSPVVRLDYPINDGGLFYTMTRELQANGYRLPETTAYNALGIPYAYPPLGFYLAGLLADLTGWSLLDIFRLLPALMSVLAIPAFYLLARELAGAETRLSLAALIFALLPATFDWLIMGGGITRSPGLVFSLLTLFCMVRLYTRRELRYVFWTSILAAATVLTHPEDALHTAASALVFFWFFGRNKAGIWKSLAVAGLTLLLTSPWWAVVLSRHGLAPFLAAGSAGWHSAEAVFALLGFNLTNESGLQTMGALALIGLFVSLAQRKYLLPVWLLVIFVSEPRSAPLYLTPALALLAAIALEEVLSLLARLEGRKSAAGELPAFAGRVPKILIALLLLQWVFSSFSLALVESASLTLTKADDRAFAWVRENTPTSSRFLVLTGQQPFTDPAAEWFPALTGRVSVATEQGHEWDGSGNFAEVHRLSAQVQQCYSQGAQCLADWLADGGGPFEYIYLRKLDQLEAVDSALLDALLASGQYELVYDTPEISILRLADK
ncbi:MAG: hypothetical protein FD146_584 [Anaerolineaceae bacterium]|nr:MAG: hypothetical protein FD146_584 [Anaerolineaceae bacterium]